MPAAVRFRVVTPDGAFVRDPFVIASVLGAPRSELRVITGAVAGEVAIALPVGDGAIDRRLASGHAINVFVSVFDARPGAAEINAAYVVAAVRLDPNGALRDVTDVTGSVVTLEPGRTAFQPVTPGALPAAGPSSYEECPPPRPGEFHAEIVECDSERVPSWAAHVEVPIAHNHGAGKDMMSHMRYNSTVVTTTEVAVQVGASGFFAANGQAGFERERSTGLEFAARGNGDNRTAYLDVGYLRSHHYRCAWGAANVRWYCQGETLYRPMEATGNFSEINYRAHDELDPEYDCWTRVDGAYEPAMKTVAREQFALTLGPSEEWASKHEGGLYANTTITQQTHTAKGFVRRWSVNNPESYNYHYMYVYLGELFATAMGLDAGGACVARDIPLARTHAANTRVDAPVGSSANPPTPVPPPDPNNPPKDPEHTFCGRMPDRCD